ncbi:MAG TPA: DUF22 domain-containing protein [Methanobacterium sp.]|nr:DUF22 domain-containing protein [Methanobacterium sp.]
MVRVISRLETVRKETAEFETKSLGDFKVGNIIGKMRAIIADENVDFKANEAKPIKIKKIKIPENHITFISAYASNKYGHAIAVGEEVQLPVSMERTVDYASFVANLDGNVKKEDLLGVLILLPIEMIK